MDESNINLPKIILFDGVCNFCNSSINFVIDHDSKKIFKFATLQSNVAQKILLPYKNETLFDSIILIDNGKIYQKSTAALNIAKNLNAGLPFIYYSLIWIPAFLRNVVYDIIAKNRYKFFGKTKICRMPTPELKARFL